MAEFKKFLKERSLPSRERGLKFFLNRSISRLHLSLPSRERGLKSINERDGRCDPASLPSRERGLKSRDLKQLLPPAVAPFAGAWIEMSCHILMSAS